MVNFGLLAAEIVSLVWGTPGNFKGFHVLTALLHGTLVVGVSQTAALNRGRHLYSTRRPSRWAFAHISSFFFSSPNLSGRTLDVCHTLTHDVALVRIWNAGLKCAAHGSLKIQDTKKVAKNRHLGTIAELCRTISSQQRHVSTIGKKLVKQQYVLQMSPQYGELRPMNG